MEENILTSWYVKAAKFTYIKGNHVSRKIIISTLVWGDVSDSIFNGDGI